MDYPPRQSPSTPALRKRNCIASSSSPPAFDSDPFQEGKNRAPAAFQLPNYQFFYRAACFFNFSICSR
jgi:hypothetical protein